MKPQPTVIWELTRACELQCRHCPHPADRSRNAQELTTYEAYCLVNQVVQLEPRRFVISGGDPLTRDDVYQLVDHARRRGLKPAIALSPTANATVEAIARLRRNGLSRIIVSLEGPTVESHDAACGVPGSYRRTVHIIGITLVSGIDVEVNTLVTPDNLPLLDALYEKLERLGVAAWNIYLPVLHPNVEPLTPAETAQLHATIERLRIGGLTEIRLMDPTASTVFITSEGYVRDGEFVSANSGDVRRSSLTQIWRSH